MTYLLYIVGGLIAAWVLYSIVLVVRGNNYHAAVRQAVLADLGSAALLILTSRPIVEQITNMYRQGEPAASTALALTMLIRSELENSN